ncbi:MAG TPA: plastocyanin/azurin family copper-binding protein [Candidatus Nitrosotalea sp.]|nr:plastocyanin/azurin family copper-binding protein [Candidatus Nitrosotalea sp.]
MRTAVILLLFVLGIAIIFPAFADSSNAAVSITGGSEAGQSCVTAKNCYDPDTVTILPKTTITWTNIDATAHTVTSGEPTENYTGEVFDSGMIGPGSTYSFMFLSPGTYDYFCSIHPWMTGEVIVESVTSSNSATTPEFGPTAMLVFILSVFPAIFLVKSKLFFKS